MPDLFRPTGRRLFPERRVSQGSHASGRRSSARQHHGHGIVSWRSAFTGLGVGGGFQAAHARGSENDSQDPGAADLLGGRTSAVTAAEPAGASGSMAWRTANYVSRWSWTGNGAPAGGFRLVRAASV